MKKYSETSLDGKNRAPTSIGTDTNFLIGYLRCELYRILL